MRKTNVLIACVVAVTGCLTITAENQNLESGGVTYDPGIGVHYVTVAEPALKKPASLGFFGGFAFDPKVLHRWMVDRTHQTILDMT